jgi:putative DNA primase/helicase
VTPHEAARAWCRAGFSVLPPRQNGSKAPRSFWDPAIRKWEWKQFSQEAASLDMIDRWYADGETTGVGLVCGAVSGNLEMLELEGRCSDTVSLDKIVAACAEVGALEIWDWIQCGYTELTPSGGFHFLYRISDHEAPGNDKLARRPATPEELADKPQDKIKTLSETRGEGGYVIVAPTHGNVHPTGGSWDLLHGAPGEVVHLTWEERCLLHEAIRLALDEMPAPMPPPDPKPSRPLAPGEKRPGDDFAERVSWHDILLPHGWVPGAHRGPGDRINWCRPGKSFGTSATTSESTGGLYVFSSSTEFEPEIPYSKFGAFTVLEHHGDFAAAARELARRGYGTRHDPLYSGTMEVAVPATVGESDGGLPVPVSPGTTAAVATRSATSIDQWDSHGVPVYEPEIFRYMPKWNGVEIGEMWAKIHENTFRHVESDKGWMRWDGKIWSKSESSLHRHSAAEMAKRLLEYAERVRTKDEELGKNLVREAKKVVTASGVNSMVTVGSAHPSIAASWDDFNKDANLVATDNGVLNLDTFELSEHDHRLMQTRKLDCSYDPTKKDGRFTRFMEEVLPDQQVREYLQRVCGYALTGEMSERVFTQLYGPSGSGKSQFIKALFNTMGDYAKTASESAFQVRPNSYKGPSEDQHQLMGARFVSHAELDESFNLNVSLIKALTGGEKVTTRKLYGNEVTWTPEYTVFMSTNHLPRVSAGEEAYWNRVKPIYFGQVFVDSEGQALNPEDRNLGERMAREEPEVILNWVLEGLKQYRERGLDAPPQIAQWRDEYRQQVDSVHQFLTEAPDEGRIEISPEKTVSVREFHKAYAAWCSDNSVPALGSRKFNQRMRDSGFQSSKHRQGVFWEGIGLTGFVVEATTPVRRGFGSWQQRE